MNAPIERIASADIAATLGVGGKTRRLGRWMSWSRAGLAIGILAVLGVGFAWLGGGQSSQTRYVTQEAKRGGLTVTVTATGTVEPTKQVEISSELSGIVKSVAVDFNDHVTRGQVLAELDTEKLDAQVGRSRATLLAKQALVTQAQATVAETDRDYRRAMSLAKSEFTSQAAVDAALAAHDRALAALAAAAADVVVAQADLKVDETNLSKACICSPIDGVVLSRDVDPGQTVASSLQAPVLFTLADDLASMQLEVDIDEADVGQVREGQHATFTVEAYQDRQFDATLTSLRFAPKTVEDVVTYTAVLSLDNSALLLRPGMTATADIVTQKLDDALLIPNAALRYAPPSTRGSSGGGGLMQLLRPRPPRERSEAKSEPDAEGERTVWALRDGAPVAAKVRVGPSDGAWTAVLEGDLKPGDRLITDAVTAK